jgi:tetratricopeptide (TPR) repeat protein
MMLRFGILVAALAIAGCDKGQEQAVETPAGQGDAPAGQARPVAEVSAVAADNKPAGPHGAYDPHAALSAESMIKVALQHRSEGRVTLAMQSIDEAAARYPQDAEVLSVRGSLYLEQGQVTPALEDFEAALRLRPDDARTLVNRSQAYRQFGRDTEAMADLDRAVVLEPDLLPARFNRGVMFQEQERYEEALADFEHCVAVDPHAPAPYFNRAAAHDALGDREAAVADLNRFIEIADDEEWKQAANDILRAWRDQAAEAGADGAAGQGADAPAGSE